jgi:hypothetical protein
VRSIATTTTIQKRARLSRHFRRTTASSFGPPCTCHKLTRGATHRDTFCSVLSPWSCHAHTHSDRRIPMRTLAHARARCLCPRMVRVATHTHPRIVRVVTHTHPRTHTRSHTQGIRQHGASDSIVSFNVQGWAPHRRLSHWV